MKVYLRESIVIPFVLNQSSSDVRLKILRLSDGYWLDFNDSTFKDSAWTTDYALMTSESNSTWKYTWTTPNAEEKYQIVFIDQDTSYQYTGPVLEVCGNTLFTVQSDAGNTAGTFKTDLPEATNDHYKAPSLIRMLTGNLKGQVRKLATTSGYNGTTHFLSTADSFTEAPQAGDKGIVITI